MRIESVTIANFLSHGPEYKFDFMECPLWLFRGLNGAGKTTVFDAVELALYGEHRLGTRQYYERLIKEGQPHAEIEVVFWHAGRRYKATRKLTSRTGNDGGSLSWWENDQWPTVPNLGNGKKAVWEYVEKHILSHEHFIASVYLHQGELGKFLAGGAEKRGQRFRGLLDTIEFDRLADAAEAKWKHERGLALSKRDEFTKLGDVSDTAFQSAAEAVESAQGNQNRCNQAIEVITLLRSNAKRWNKAQERILELEGVIKSQTALLQQSNEITAAAGEVSAWDKIAPTLQRFWSLRDRANETRRKAESAQSAAAEAAAKAGQFAEQRRGIDEQIVSLRETDLPMLTKRLKEANDRLASASLEYDIAAQVTLRREAAVTVNRLKDAPGKLREWEAMEQALPALKEVVAARMAVLKATQGLAGLDAQIAEAESAERTAKQAKKDAQIALKEKGEAHEATVNECRDASNRLRSLRDEIEKHKQLSEEADRCPICDRDLDTNARRHVKQAIRDKSAELQRLSTKMASATKAEKDAKKALEKAQIASDDAAQAYDDSRQAVDARRANRETKQTAADKDKERLERRKKAALRQAKAFAAQLDSITQTQVVTLEKQLLRQRQGIHHDADAYTEAYNQVRDAESQLKALRPRRLGAAKEGPGEAGDMTVLERQKREAEQVAKEQQQAINALNTEMERLGQELLTVEGQRAGQVAVAESKSKQAKEEIEAVERIEQESRLITVPELCAPLMADRQTYDARTQEIENQRPLARQAEALEQANAELERLQARRKTIIQECQDIPEEHHVPEGVAEQKVTEARANQEHAGRVYTEASNALAVLVQKRTDASRLEIEVQTAERRHKIFADLAHDLGANGLVQDRLAQAVQDEICALANEILSHAGDSFRIDLGDPVRQGTAEKDLVFIDQTDPAAVERLYESLSAGEKTRVAMAVSAAIHRRASGEPGTLIIDEAFADLDNVQRFAYAQEISDRARGWIELGLVSQVIVATHHDDVYRYFPARYEIEKIDGFAQVTRVLD